VRRLAAAVSGSISARSKESHRTRSSHGSRRKGLLPQLEKPYDQAKVDLIKAEIIEIYKDYGIAVGADSSLEPTRDRRAVRILIEFNRVYKQ
jgi:hypothetical protein